MTLKKRRIFVIDDHPVMRDGLRCIINAEPGMTVCGETGDALLVLPSISSLRPDLIILDLTLGRRSGLDVLKDLSIQHPSIPVVVVSMHDEALYAERALQAGARGYLMKAETSESLLAAVTRVLEGNIFVSQRVVTSIAGRLGQRTTSTLPVKQLTDRELHLFELIATGLSTLEIAQNMNVSRKSVQAYLKSVRQKFGLTKFSDVLREAIRWQNSVER